MAIKIAFNNNTIKDRDMPEHSTDNVYLTDPLRSVFIRTAAPIIIMMLVNGSFNLVDAYFLGSFVGKNALAAVTSMFPAFMLIVALSTLVSNGFASIMARRLSAGQRSTASNTFAQAITLALLVCSILIALFLIGGERMTLIANNYSVELASMSYSYIFILIACSPIVFILSINGDCLRCEGQIAFMALISLTSVLLNGLFNYVFIVHFDLGVAGSAYGTVMAQSLSLFAIFLFRRYKPTGLKVQVVMLSTSRNHWREFLTLGAPSSLNYIGIVLSSAAILYNLQFWHNGDYNATVTAYGIITRLMTFIFLPLLGLSMAFQSIAGNNFGAKKWTRTNSCIKIALLAALIYSMSMQGVVLLIKDSLGAWFVEDTGVINEVSRILTFSTMTLFLLGPLMIISTFFQSIGDAARASLLGITKTYLFLLPMIFVFPTLFGEWGIWYAAPSAEVLALLFTLGILYQHSRQHSYRLGLFYRA